MAIVSEKPKNTFKTIALTGFVVGLLDGIAAIVSNIMVGPIRIFQYIASAAIGKDAFSGGLGTASLGLFFHFLIAYSFSFFFFFVYPKLKILPKFKILVGFAYGLFVWLVMNMAILPIFFSNIPTFDLSKSWINILIHLFLVGLPISLLFHRHVSQK
jgi:uncharacterized membrane protein YagU involved in acid resistance